MLAVIQFRHRQMADTELAALLQVCFSMNLSALNALSISRRFRSVPDLPPSVFYACRPTIDSLAIFFRLSDSAFECILEGSLERAETIYRACDSVVVEVCNRFRGSKLERLELEEENGRRTDVSAQLSTFWESFHKKLELRDWIFMGVSSVILFGASFKFAGLVDAAIVGSISFGAMLLVSGLQSLWDSTHRRLEWRVQ